MERDIIHRIIIEGQEFANEISLIKHPFFFEKNDNYVFVGIRQAGKSYLLYQRIQQLIREGHSIEEIIYINFDDERLRQMTSEDTGHFTMPESYQGTNNHSNSVFLLLSMEETGFPL